MRVARARQRLCGRRRQAAAEAGSARCRRRRPGARAWSSLGISAWSVALVLAAPAGAAGVDVSPRRIDPGGTARIAFWVSNDGKVPIVAVAVGIPVDFRLGEAETKGSWRTSVHKRTVSWDGYKIRPGQFAFFTLTVKAPQREERAMFTILSSAQNGSTRTQQATVDVVPPQPTNDASARRVATIALVIAIVGSVAALGAGILALWLWLRPRSTDVF